MSQFNGGNKVRCIDCSRLNGTTCSAKSTSVAVKKRRTCSQYKFKGEYENSTPLPSVYVPHVDKATKRLMKKLMKMGVMPMQGTRPHPVEGPNPYGEEATPVVNPAAFQTTATALFPEVKPLESVGEEARVEVPNQESQEGTTVVWSPEDGDKTESE